MSGRIGWYVHHHGRGHLTRFLAIAPHLDAEVACFSTLEAPADLPAHCSWTQLPRDDDASDGRSPGDGDPTAGGLLHWVPLDHPGHRARLASIADAIAARSLDAFVVDVSVEVTLLARLMGVRPVVFTQPGERDDHAHRLAFAAAHTVIAPWPQPLLHPPHLSRLGAKVVFTGGISRFDGREHAAPVPLRRDGHVVLLGGAGGSTVTAEDITAAAAATGRPWTALGDATWQDDPWDALATADVVISWAGQNSIADLAAARARAVVIPQPRPFDEQAVTAGILSRHRLAVVRNAWPFSETWPDLLREAETRVPDWARWEVAGAAERAAAAVVTVARRDG